MLEKLDEILCKILGSSFLVKNKIILGQIIITEEIYRGNRTLVADSFVNGFKPIIIQYPYNLSDFFVALSFSDNLDIPTKEYLDKIIDSIQKHKL